MKYLKNLIKAFFAWIISDLAVLATLSILPKTIARSVENIIMCVVYFGMFFVVYSFPFSNYFKRLKQKIAEKREPKIPPQIIKLLDEIGEESS